MSNTVPAAETGLPIPTRRIALASLAGLGVGLALPERARADKATTLKPNAIERLRNEARQAWAECNAPGTDHSDDETDALLERAGAAERQACIEPITTNAEAVTALDWEREEVGTERRHGRRADDFVDDMVGNVIAYLTAKGGAA